MNLDEENQDIVGELIDNTGIAGSAIISGPVENGCDNEEKKASEEGAETPNLESEDPA